MCASLMSELSIEAAFSYMTNTVKIIQFEGTKYLRLTAVKVTQ